MEAVRLRTNLDYSDTQQSIQLHICVQLGRQTVNITSRPESVTNWARFKSRGPCRTLHLNNPIKQRSMFLADLRTLLTAMKILQWLEKTLRMIWRHQTWQTPFKCVRGLQGFSGFCKFMKRTKLSKSVFFLSFQPDKFCHRVQKYISERKPHHYEPDHETFLSSSTSFHTGRQKLFWQIFFSKVTRTHMRQSSWLPLCALRLHEIYPFFFSLPSLRFIEERNSKEGDSILRIIHIWTPVNNACIRHCASLDNFV